MKYSVFLVLLTDNVSWYKMDVYVE